MKTIKAIIFILIFNTSISAQTITIPELNNSVTDLTETLNDSEISQLKAKLLNFENDSLGQFVILLIPTTGTEIIEEYSIRLAEKWKIGFKDKDNGIIMLIAKNDRKIRIEVGYGLENRITDADTRNIIYEQIIPEFKNGSYYDGINNGISAISDIIKVDKISKSQILLIINKKNNAPEKEINWLIPAIFALIISIMLPAFLFKQNILFFIILLIIVTGVNYFIGQHLSNSVGIIFAVISGFSIASIILIKLLVLIFGKNGGSSSSSFFDGGYSSSSSSNNWSSSSNNWGSSSSNSSSTYSSSSGYSGGGGSFGGGGATGSW